MPEPNTSSTKPIAPPLGKHLASTEKKTRDEAIKSLAAYLSDESQRSMSPSERAKLWKGIFYCFWMSDKPIVQQDLSQELANLILVIPSLESALGFVCGFWEATVREWAGIDRHRINKFYMLIRRFVNATFRLLLNHGWDAEACEKVNRILEDKGGPLCPDDKTVPASLSYHLADIYLEELDKVLDTSDRQHETPLLTLIDPFIKLSARTPNKITYDRMQTALVTPLLDALAARSSASDANESGSQRKRKRSAEAYPNLIDSACASPPRTNDAESNQTGTKAQNVAKSVVKAIFETAGQGETKDANRRKMYALWKRRMEDYEGETQSGDADGVLS